jgi:hypothetical protein
MGLDPHRLRDGRLHDRRDRHPLRRRRHALGPTGPDANHHH